MIERKEGGRRSDISLEDVWRGRCWERRSKRGFDVERCGGMSEASRASFLSEASK
jgi:hypothetical protein